MDFKLHHGDCLDILKELPDNSVDSIVTDPPYGLQFMGKRWDYDVPSVEIWKECLRVLKPGGHLLSFAGARTHHRMVVNIEDAGFEIRDMIAWVYASGFPKNLNVSKDIDRIKGTPPTVVGERAHTSAKMAAGNGVSGLKQAGGHAGDYEGERVSVPLTAPTSEEAKQWDGWGTALKPAIEPICVARKPLSESSVARNVLKWGTGAINIEASRVAGVVQSGAGSWGFGKRDDNYEEGAGRQYQSTGRWPANLIHDGSDEVLASFPDTGKSGTAVNRNRGERIPSTVNYANHGTEDFGYNDGGSASRFFYCAKASPADRNEGLEEVEGKMRNDGRKTPIDNPYQRGKILKNHHPTVKPTALMRYLCRLVTPPQGIVLDPFMGSGSTGKAAMLEGFAFIGIEREEEYLELATRRIERSKIDTRII